MRIEKDTAPAQVSETGQAETHAERGASAQIAVRVSLSLKVYGRARKPKQIGAMARLHHACMPAPLHTVHVFLLSCSATLIPPRYLNCILINLDVATFAAKFGVDEVFGC